MKTSKVIVFLLVLSIFLMPLTSAGFFSKLLEKLKITGKSPTSTVTVNISIGNTAPIIPNVTIVASQSVTENTMSNVSFYFIAADGDGAGNLDATTARANFSKTNEGLRENATCLYSHQINTSNRQYNCTIGVWYWDLNGLWNISVAIADLSSSWAVNISQTFNLGDTTAIVSAPSALSWTGVYPSSVNKTADALLKINNTGNHNVTRHGVNVTAINLLGENNPAKALYAGNFSVSNSTGASLECNDATSTLLVNATTMNITNSALARGNLSQGSGTAQEDLYFCLRIAGSELSTQAYSSTRAGGWTVSVV